MRLIPLHARDGTVRAWTCVDDADYEDVGRFPWSLGVGGYAFRRRDDHSHWLLHRVLMGLEHGNPLQVDHINGDPLDNRRTNLRVVTTGQQAQNKVRTDGRSAYRGVDFHKASGLWRARVKVGGAYVFCKYFRTEGEAGRAAAEARAIYMPFSVKGR